ncbi:hypothetical protein JK358_38450 [Nocardia sp. 2]|uniref:Uncharacterized protein n=1 Tax=Nocardia acididurans TaxID=2802282 RepID=A0ABS1MI08_9NOCA|nr:RRQRL motif-containing zinc-binding protein [Nocardia acididurans]MBL1080293.1 hypothetical protein [Nocardia acididurans]
MTRESDGALPVYRWMAAPPHLKARRQLRDAGLSPGRQDIAAKMERPRKRRNPLVAYLFDITKAVPRRTSTPAQRAALERANRDRQIEAAERRGISLVEDTGPDLPATGPPTPSAPHTVAAALARHALAEATRTALTCCALPASALEAVTAWRSDPPTAQTAAAYLADEPERRDRLEAQLIALSLPAHAERDVALIFEYVDGRTPHTDLLHTSVLIDPALAARGRVDGLLARYARHGAPFAAALAAETGALTLADQQRVRSAVRELAQGHRFTPLWPDHVDRNLLTARLHALARAPHPARDAVAGQITHLLAGRGLHPLERERLSQCCHELAAHPDQHDLPPLLLLDEASKHHHELARHRARAALLGHGTGEKVRTVLPDPVITAPGMRNSLRAVTDDIAWLARGHHTRAELTSRRNTYHQHLTRLHQQMVTAHLPRAQRAQVREILDTALHTAARAGRHRDQRDRAWDHRLRPGPTAVSARLLTAVAATNARAHTPDHPAPQLLPSDIGQQAAAAVEVAP